MTPWLKSLKPLRFLSLTLAAGLAGAYFSQMAQAALTDGKKNCVEDFSKELKRFSRLDLTKLDPKTRCTASEGAENDLALGAEKRGKLELKKGEKVGTSFPGACPASYEAVQLVYEKILEARAATCEKIYNELDEKFPDCLSAKPAESCKKNIDEIVTIYDNGKKDLHDNVRKGIRFLKIHWEFNETAKEKFVKDLNQLQQIRAQNRQELLVGPATPPEVTHSVVATSQGSTTLAEYLQKLELRKPHARSQVSPAPGAAIPATSPIDEQAEARKFAMDFSGKLSSISEKENENYQNNISAFKLSLENKLDTPGNSTVDKALQYAPVAAPLATGLLSGANNPSSAVAGASTGALPALALMGAAGAAGIAMGSKTTGASADLGGSMAGVEGPVMTPNNKASGTEFGGTETAQGPAPLPSSPLATTDTGKDEKAVEGNTVVASNGALAAALGGGASLMPGKSKANRDVASNSASPAAAGDDALKTFGGDLRPAPRPAAAADNAGNDVSNLLGKMKDLFNMDDTFGGDIPPPDMSGGGAHASSSGGGSPAGGGDEYVGDDYSGGEETQAGSDYGGEEETYQGSNPMGSIDVTLFRRVHARHVKCMEKGLVILMSQELPE